MITLGGLQYFIFYAFFVTKRNKCKNYSGIVFPKIDIYNTTAQKYMKDLCNVSLHRQGFIWNKKPEDVCE